MTGFELVLEYLTKYSPILIFIVLAMGFGLVTLALSYLVQPKYPEPEKLSVYECGSEPFSDSRMPFPVRYYVIAMLFVIFDIRSHFPLSVGCHIQTAWHYRLHRNDDFYWSFYGGVCLCLAEGSTRMGLTRMLKIVDSCRRRAKAAMATARVLDIDWKFKV